MNKFWIILSHTYMSRVKTKVFIISTLVTLLFIVAVANIQPIMGVFVNDEPNEIAVLDDSGELFDVLKDTTEEVNEDIELVAFKESKDNAIEAVSDGDYEALIILSLNESKLPEADYYANNIADVGLQGELESQLQQVKVALATSQAGIDQSTLTDIYAPVEFNVSALDETAKTDEELNQARGIVYVMLFVLYMAIIIYGQMIATDVATEKSSRVMEILVSSAPPVTHMFAKIIGIALLGLTQVGLFVLVGYGMITMKADELTGGVFEYFGVQNTSLSVYIYAIIFFLLGYLLYATLAAMLGSLVSRVEDVGQMIMPMIFLIMIAFFIAIFGLSAPDSTIVYISSFIPFFSPMLMFMRVGMLDVPIWEISLSIGLLIGSIALLGILGARVYKGGVLMYGRSNSLKDFKKALALSKKE